MANFTINIDPDTLYTANNITVSEEVCETVQKNIPLGVATNNNNTLINFLLDNVTTTSSWTNLIIDNISYSDELTTRIVHNGQTINASNTPYVIDISSIGFNDIIPGLEVVYNLLQNGSANNIASYTVKLETSTHTNYKSLEGNVIVQNTGCFQPLEPQVSPVVISAKGGCGDGDTQAFTVSSPVNTSVKWVIEEIDHGNHGYHFSIMETDTLDGDNIRTVLGLGPYWNDRFIIEDYDVPQKHYRVSLCARPSLESEPNEVEVKVHIRNRADTGDVFTTTLIDDDI